ncbi:GNAT family N-acetyltransferase [Halapricum hydrolyticum]|uniref:GNAT family N-acetyltransferase n=1 Tax=Halapricum hydrolyticum TaxID=2979991 RepID=A0AAE3LDT0_9EURY|nr:GNAT family N-acetyltransferase [Halapricum hydrolyticum]MCU4716933.1 GNAT family N-acetyltransferase [Halapricum hydrolyticum]MCU4725462.1 GNAT family N-acetyltransferase [Halapricum hydrolyticum]
MNVRPATPADRPAIRDIARRSLQTSYSLSPQAITSAIEEWYTEDNLCERLNDEDRLLLVADRDGQVVGFSESTLEDAVVFEDSGAQQKAMLLWLHVDPSYRGEGIGMDLFEATRDRLRKQGASTIQGRVLAENSEGNSFFERLGFQQVGRRDVEIASRTHVENIYIEEPSGLTVCETPAGETVYVDRDDAERGSLGPFYPVYADQNRGERYGYYCGSCEQLANAMDAMGRIECDNCGNSRKPTRWDAAYL